jgi:hypothetical protein
LQGLRIEEMVLVAAGSLRMKITLLLLIILGVVAQALAIFATWYELGPMLRGERGIDVLGTALLFLPSVLGFGGAAFAARLDSRGSGWAWVVAGVPLVLLGLALCLAAFLWENPIRH